MTCIAGFLENNIIHLGADSAGTAGNDDDFSFEFMVTKFIPRLITLYSESGYDKKYDDGEKKGGSFIIASKDKLYGIDNDFQIAEHLDNYIAMGSGDTVSYGALYTLDVIDNLLTPEDKMKIIIGASCYFKTSVAPPINYMNTRDGTLCKL